MARKQIDCFRLDERIGGGSYGEVWRGRNMACAQQIVALRRVHRRVEAKIQRLKGEVRLLRQVSHTNILQLHGLRKSPSYFYLALEYCGGGDLAQLLRARGPLPETDSWRFCVQITAGLLALHCSSLVHGNLQPGSVLLTDSSEDPKLKLANFTSKPEHNPYMAPEVLRGQPCDGHSDMWSAGVILYEMLFGRPPFCGNSRSQLLASHLSGEVSFAEEDAVTGEGRAFCRSLLGRSVSERLSSHACAAHSWVKRGPRKRTSTQATRRAAAVHRNAATKHCQALVQVSPSLEIQLAQIWPLSTARLACAKIAQGFLRELEGFSHTSKKTGEVDPEVDGEFESRLATNHRQLGPGGLFRTLLINSDPLTRFVVGQLQYSHFFHLRTARLFPRVLYAI